MNLELNVNSRPHSVDVEPDTPLLWVLRDTIGLTGTKFGCGIAACGACTVLVEGRAVRSCTFPVSSAVGAAITTIEGLGDYRERPAGRSSSQSSSEGRHPVQQAWIDHQVPQCGYCQSGVIMAVAAFLAEHPRPTDEEIDAGITNICRCGTFVRVRRAIHAIADE